MDDSILLTVEIRALRAMGRMMDAKAVDWALALLEGGHNETSVAVLAGELPPFNPFEMNELVDRALKELEIAPHGSREDAAVAFTSVRVKQHLDKQMSAEQMLAELSALCIELDYLDEIYDFYLFHFGLDDLKHGEFCYHLPEANRENIHQLLHDRCRQWLHAHPVDG